MGVHGIVDQQLELLFKYPLYNWHPTCGAKAKTEPTQSFVLFVRSAATAEGFTRGGRDPVTDPRMTTKD